MSSYKYNPVTAPLQRQYDTFSDIEMEIDEGTNLAGTNKWSGSVRANNGKIYNIPKDATDILVIDEKTNDVYRTNMGLGLTGTNKWDGGVLGADGKIYCVPNSSSSILVIDPNNDTAELKDYGLDLSSTWSGGILAPNGKVYFIPRTSVNVVVIDTVLQTAVMTDMGTAIAEPNGPNVEALKIKYNNVYFVSPLGDDANDGSEGAPFASIDVAAQAASATGDAIFIAGGEHILGGGGWRGLDNFGKEVSFYGVPSKTVVRLEFTGRDVPFMSGSGKSKVFNLILIRDARGKSRNYEVAVFKSTRDFEVYNTVFKSINGRGITISYFNGGATVGKLVNCIFDLEDGVNFGGSYSGANTGLVLENCASTGNFLNGQQTLVNTTQGVDFDADYSIIDNTSSTDDDPNDTYGVYAGEYKWTETSNGYDIISNKTYNNVYHVAVSGDDTNDGSQMSPFASVYKATEVAQSGDAIFIDEGEYLLDKEPGSFGVNAGLNNRGKNIDFYGVPSKTILDVTTTSQSTPFFSGEGISHIYNMVVIRDANFRTTDWYTPIISHTYEIYVYNTVIRSVNNSNVTVTHQPYSTTPITGRFTNCTFDIEGGVDFTASYNAASRDLIFENCVTNVSFFDENTLINTAERKIIGEDFYILSGPNAVYGVYAGEYKWTEAAINDWFYSTTELYSGAVLGNDGKIYGIPYSAQNVLIIDPINETLSVDSLGATLSGLSKWKGGVLGKDGKIYGIPYNSSDILVIDTETQSAQRSDMGLQTDGLSKWNNGALGSDDKIYAYPEDSNKILVIDTNLNTVDYLDTHIDMRGTNKYNGGISTVSSSGYMYAAPSDALDILMISTNPQLNSYQEAYRNTCFHNLGGGTSTSEDKYSDCRFSNNDKLYCLPNDNSLNFLVIDKNKNITYKNPAKFEQTEAVDDGKSIIRKRYDNVYFVSIDGDDDNNDGSQENPFATYYKAAETAQSGDAIFIDEGEYVLDRSFSRFSTYSGLYLYGKELDIYGVPLKTIIRIVNNNTGDAGRDIPFISSNGNGRAKIFNISFIRDANFRTLNYATTMLSFIPFVQVYNCAFKSINNANVSMSHFDRNVVRGKLVNCTFDIEGGVDFTASYNGVSIDLILENCVSNVSFFDANTYINTTENATLDAQFNIVSPTGINNAIGVYGGEYNWTPSGLNGYDIILNRPYDNVYFVSVNGDDDNNDGSQESPFATYYKAIDVAQSGDAIFIGEGEYLLDNPDLNESGLNNRGKDLDFYGVPSRTILRIEHTGRSVPFMSGSGKSKVFNLTLIRDARGKSRNYDVAVFRFTRDFEVYNTVFNSINGKGISMSHYNNGATVGKLVNCTFDIEGGVNFGSSYSGANTGLVLENCASTGSFRAGEQTLVNTTENAFLDSQFNIIDPTGINDTIGVYGGEYKWLNQYTPVLIGSDYASVLAPNGNIYCISSKPNNILIIDQEKDILSLENFGLRFESTDTWMGAVVGNDGKIYGIPYDSTRILVINPDDNTAEFKDYGLDLSGTEKWWGGVLAHDGKIYCMPYNATELLVIDPLNDTAELTDLGASLSGFALTGNKKWKGGCLGANGVIYGIPYDANNFLVIDLNLNFTSRDNLGLSLALNGNNFNGATVSSNGKIYAVPAQERGILEIDPYKKEAKIINDNTYSTIDPKWVSTFCDDNGTVYGVPAKAENIVRIRPKKKYNMTMNPELALSPYYNKF